MITIHKFPVKLDVPMEIPGLSRVLKLAFQRDELMLWAMVDTEDSNINVVEPIVKYGTGWEIDCTKGPDTYYNPYSLDYIDTLVDSAGYVWHFFYKVS